MQMLELERSGTGFIWPELVGPPMVIFEHIHWLSGESPDDWSTETSPCRLTAVHCDAGSDSPGECDMDPDYPEDAVLGYDNGPVSSCLSHQKLWVTERVNHSNWSLPDQWLITRIVFTDSDGRDGQRTCFIPHVEMTEYGPVWWCGHDDGVYAVDCTRLP